jgi:hypothetical protein
MKLCAFLLFTPTLNLVKIKSKCKSTKDQLFFEIAASNATESQIITPKINKLVTNLT